MAKVTLCTVQDKRVVLKILNGTYKPEFSKSYGVLDEVTRNAYRYMLGRLSEKTGVEYEWGKDTCIWSWFQYPFLENLINYRYKGIEMVVITFEIDESEVVFSDFDRWSEMFIDGKNVDSVVSLEDIDRVRGSGENRYQCIQAVSWGIPKDGIISIVPLGQYLKNYRELLIGGQ